MRGLKEKAARSGWLLLSVWALTTAWADDAHAQEPRVLVLTPPEASGGFLSALQIQLVGLATPERTLQPAAATAAERIETAGALARSQQALCAVSVELPPENTDAPAILYVVGERAGRALVEVVRVPGGRGPELDRTLALKVREIVSELARTRANAPPETLLQAPQPTAATPAPTLEPSPGDESSLPLRLNGAAALSVRIGSQPQIGLNRWGIGLQLGPVIELPSLRFAGLLGIDWFPPVDVESDGDRARFRELAGTLTFQVQHDVGGVWLGAMTGPQFVALNARGTTANGTRGAPYASSLWAWIAGVGAEVQLGAGVGLGAELQIQALLRDQRFTVNDREIVEFGRTRVRLGLVLTFRPFGDSPQPGPSASAGGSSGGGG